MSTLADALKPSSRFHKWANDDGTRNPVVSGRIVSAELRQSTKFGSDEPDTWDDGTPKMQAVLTLQTDERDPADPDDDGQRRVAVNLWSGQKRALIQACKEAGVSEPKPGMTFTARWESGVGTAASPRVFSYRLEGSALGAALTAPEPVGDLGTKAAAAAKPLGEQAKEYLQQGLDVQTVAGMTGLPAATVAAIANTLNTPPF